MRCWLSATSSSSLTPTRTTLSPAKSLPRQDPPALDTQIDNPEHYKHRRCCTDGDVEPVLDSL